MGNQESTAKSFSAANHPIDLRIIQEKLSRMGENWTAGAGQFGQVGGVIGQVTSRMFACSLSEYQAMVGAMIEGQALASREMGEASRRVCDLMQNNGQAIAEQLRDGVGCRDMREASAVHATMIRTVSDCVVAVSDAVRDSTARVFLAGLEPMLVVLRGLGNDGDDVDDVRAEPKSRRTASER
jgi:hypothetical protein